MKRSRTRLSITFVLLQMLISTLLLPAPLAAADEEPATGPTAPLAIHMYLPLVGSAPTGPVNDEPADVEPEFASQHARLLALMTSRIVVMPEGVLAFSLQPTADEIGAETDAYAKILLGLEETNQLLRAGQISLAELGFGAGSTQITAASASSLIHFTIYRAPSRWSVMLEKRQWWGWEYQYTRYMDYTSFYGLGSGTYRLRITGWSGWRTCSPASVNVNGWNQAFITCVG